LSKNQHLKKGTAIALSYPGRGFKGVCKWKPTELFITFAFTNPDHSIGKKLQIGVVT
jgi:hypothetical protein